MLMADVIVIAFLLLGLWLFAPAVRGMLARPAKAEQQTAPVRESKKARKQREAAERAIAEAVNMVRVAHTLVHRFDTVEDVLDVRPDLGRIEDVLPLLEGSHLQFDGQIAYCYSSKGICILDFSSGLCNVHYPDGALLRPARPSRVQSSASAVPEPPEGY